MAKREMVVILDFGSQYSHLIARRVREAEVYCELVSCYESPERIAALDPKGFILSGGPASVYAPRAPRLPEYVLASGRPVLGICYGMQLLAQNLGGQVDPAPKREYGPAQIELCDEGTPLLRNCNLSKVWMSHGDRITKVPTGFYIMARSSNSPVAAMGDPERRLYGLQFHPEVRHTSEGQTILRTFLYEICGCQGGWTPLSFIDEAIVKIQAQVGTDGVVCGLSGGVDSAVTAMLVHRAIGDQLTCIFVNNGLMRLGEPEDVVTNWNRFMQVRLRAVDASEAFLSDLDGIVDPEEKRRRIGTRFVRVFEDQARELGNISYLAQGTLYPDVIESATPDQPAAAKIKTHHNVGGLPADMKFRLVEPLRYLFKDEVRRVGEAWTAPKDGVAASISWSWFGNPYIGGSDLGTTGDLTPRRRDFY